MNWIPMKEKQPTKEGWYMVTIKDTNNVLTHVVETDYWEVFSDYANWNIYEDSVLAWAELPEPYREAQNG